MNPEFIFRLGIVILIVLLIHHLIYVRFILDYPDLFYVKRTNYLKIMDLNMRSNIIKIAYLSKKKK